MRAMLFACLVAFPVFALSGCGGGSDDETEVTAAAPAIPAHRRSAEAIVEFFNRHSTGEVVERELLLPEFYAENELQERILRVRREALPVFRYAAAMKTQFGEGIFGRTPASPDPSGNGPATITSREAARAQAEFRSSDEKTATLYLVKVGDEWRLSGYTLEYSPSVDVDKVPSQAEIDAHLRGLRHAFQAAAQIHPRVSAGDFASAQEAREAFSVASNALMGRGG